LRSLRLSVTGLLLPLWRSRRRLRRRRGGLGSRGEGRELEGVVPRSRAAGAGLPLRLPEAARADLARARSPSTGRCGPRPRPGGVSIAAMCELAEESAGGGDLGELRARLVELRLTERPRASRRPRSPRRSSRRRSGRPRGSRASLSRRHRARGGQARADAGPGRRLALRGGDEERHAGGRRARRGGHPLLQGPARLAGS
jgi:hypothetical protein